jgi:hypothetical protein
LLAAAAQIAPSPLPASSKGLLVDISTARPQQARRKPTWRHRRLGFAGRVSIAGCARIHSSDVAVGHRGAGRNRGHLGARHGAFLAPKASIASPQPLLP